MELTSRISHKRRHTKPCRFFQDMSCPRSADKCNFAHVLSHESLLQPPPKPCRSGRAGPGGFTPSTYQHSATVFTNDGTAVGEQPSISIVTSIPFPTLGVYMTSPAWPSSPDIVGSYCANDGDTSQLSQSIIPSPDSSLYSQSSFASSSCSSVSDDVVIVTEDPNYGEHPHPYQSLVRVAEDPYTVHLPPYYPVHMPVYHYSPPVYRKPPTSQSRSRYRSSSRQKTINHKTKLCKFFHKKGSCPNGELCTFIHDETPPKVEAKSDAQPPQEIQPKLPLRPLSTTEVSHKNGYFPVSWRVIGGGVLIGGKKSPNSSHTKVSCDTRATRSSQTPSTPPPNFDIASTTLPVIMDTANTTMYTPVRGRARACSIPSTPSPTLMKIQTLFSAESPGSL